VLRLGRVLAHSVGPPGEARLAGTLPCESGASMQVQRPACGFIAPQTRPLLETAVAPIALLAGAARATRRPNAVEATAHDDRPRADVHRKLVNCHRPAASRNLRGIPTIAAGWCLDAERCASSFVSVFACGASAWLSRE
jgi:hypothetical protein